jgi:hypothetical protein
MSDQTPPVLSRRPLLEHRVEPSVSLLWDPPAKSHREHFPESPTASARMSFPRRACPRPDRGRKSRVLSHREHRGHREPMEPQINAETDSVIPAKLVLDLIEEQESSLLTAEDAEVFNGRLSTDNRELTTLLPTRSLVGCAPHTDSFSTAKYANHAKKTPRMSLRAKRGNLRFHVIPDPRSGRGQALIGNPLPLPSRRDAGTQRSSANSQQLTTALFTTKACPRAGGGYEGHDGSLLTTNNRSSHWQSATVSSHLPQSTIINHR